MKFNPDLIQKARKGEIAILNDGGADALNEIMQEVRPGTDKHNGFFKYYKNSAPGWYTSDDSIFLRCPIKSAKEFFMPDTYCPDTTSDPKSYLTEITKPQRTYKVTRGQMKELHDAVSGSLHKIRIREMVGQCFPEFEMEWALPEGYVKELSLKTVILDKLKSIFPEYFFIPEGEPVLVRLNDFYVWTIRISDGKGSFFLDGKLSGETHSQGSEYQIIPFTKNPPK